MMPITLQWTTASTCATATAGIIQLSSNNSTTGLISSAYLNSNITIMGTPIQASINPWYSNGMIQGMQQQVNAAFAQAVHQNAYNPQPHPRPEPPPHVAAQKVAARRARKLLMSALSPAQRKTYELFGAFDVHVGGKTYRIHQGTHGNVRELGDDGRERYLWCAQPDHVPAEDAMLAQMLLLRHDEAAFRRVANRRPI